MKKRRFFGGMVLAVMLLLTGCSKTVAYSGNETARLVTGERSGLNYTLMQDAAPVYHDLAVKPQPLTESQVNALRDALGVCEGDQFEYYEDPYSKDATLHFERGTAHGMGADISAPPTAADEASALQWANDFLRQMNIFPDEEYITEVVAGAVCNVNYYLTYKGVPITHACIYVTYDKRGVRYFYYAWNKVTSSGRAYTEGEVCTVQEAVNKYERSLSYSVVQKPYTSMQNFFVRQVYIYTVEQEESWFRQIFTGDSSYDKRIICPGWAFCESEQDPLRQMRTEIKAVPD